MKHHRRHTAVVGLVSALVAAVLLAPAAPSRTGHPASSRSPKRTVRCKTILTVRIPSGSTQVVPGQNRGTQFGDEVCGQPFGAGVQSDGFALQLSGDYTGTFTKWLHSGTVSGTYDLTPVQSGFNFSTADFTGTLAVKRGTGAFAGAHGGGTSRCHSPDGVHETCQETLTVSGLGAG